MEKATFISANKGNSVSAIKGMINASSVEFKILYHKDNEGFQKDKNQECLIKIFLTQFALERWNKGNANEQELIKMAFPFADILIKEKMKEGTLNEYEEKILSREDKVFPFPYDTGKMGNIENYEIVVGN